MLKIKEQIIQDLTKIVENSKPIFFGKGEEVSQEDWEFEFRAAVFGNISHYFDKSIPPYNKED